jgi:hypothetical protein
VAKGGEGREGGLPESVCLSGEWEGIEGRWDGDAVGVLMGLGNTKEDKEVRVTVTVKGDQPGYYKGSPRKREGWKAYERVLRDMARVDKSGSELQVTKVFAGWCWRWLNYCRIPVWVY